jgi:uncharacterized phage protein (TIGR02220 family)
MKYTININQKAVIDLGLDLDIVDMAIFDVIYHFQNSSSCEKINTADGVYFWMSHKKIIQDLPMIGIKSKRGIINRIDNLVNASLLIKHPECQKRSRTYYKLGENSERIFFHTYERNFIAPMNENSEPPMNENSEDYNTIVYNNTIYNNYCEELIEFFNEITGRPEKRKIKLTASRKKSILARLKEFTIDEIKDAWRFKYLQWKGKDMERHFNIETLTRASKLPKYVDELAIFEMRPSAFPDVKRQVNTNEKIREKLRELV